jgi:hypothetical protein
MAIGLAQGVLLYLLYRAFAAHAWPATEPMLFVTVGAAGAVPGRRLLHCALSGDDRRGRTAPHRVLPRLFRDRVEGRGPAWLWPTPRLAEDSQGRWSVIGTLPAGVAGCGALRDAIAAGRVRAAEPAGKALEIDGHRLGVRYPADSPLYRCPR